MSLRHFRSSWICTLALTWTGLVILGGASGCSHSGGEYGSVVTDAQKTQIVKGKTTQIEILRVLGNPDQKIDLGNGKEQFSYIKETTRNTVGPVSAEHISSYTEYWIIFDKGVVADTGEQPTTKQPNYFK